MFFFFNSSFSDTLSKPEQQNIYTYIYIIKLVQLCSVPAGNRPARFTAPKSDAATRASFILTHSRAVLGLSIVWPRPHYVGAWRFYLTQGRFWLHTVIVTLTHHFTCCTSHCFRSNEDIGNTTYSICIDLETFGHYFSKTMLLFSDGRSRWLRFFSRSRSGPYTPSLKLFPIVVFCDVASLVVTEVGFAVAKHQDETPETLLEALSWGYNDFGCNDLGLSENRLNP